MTNSNNNNNELVISAAATAFRNFVKACKTPDTRTVYTMGLHYYMDYLGIPREQYDKLLPPEKDSRTIQMDIRGYATYLSQEQKRSYATISTYVAAISKFYAKNFVVVNIKDIRDYMGEHEKVAEDRPYTHSEIQTLLANTDRRNKAIILLMCSSAARYGAIPPLRIRDLTPIDNYNIYKIHYYAKSKKHNYHSYCTPECRSAIDEYLEYRRRWGERITDDSPLFRVDYNAMLIEKNAHAQVQSITRQSIHNFMVMLLLRTGLRQVPTETAKGEHKRLEVMMTHGMRKFFEKNAYKAGMDHMYIRRLMGQKSGLEDAYLKLSDEELLEGDNKHVGYIGIIDQLTINEENRLKREVQTLRIDKSKMEQVLERINLLENKILNQQ